MTFASFTQIVPLTFVIVTFSPRAVSNEAPSVKLVEYRVCPGMNVYLAKFSTCCGDGIAKFFATTFGLFVAKKVVFGEFAISVRISLFWSFKTGATRAIK